MMMLGSRRTLDKKRGVGGLVVVFLLTVCRFNHKNRTNCQVHSCRCKKTQVVFVSDQNHKTQKQVVDNKPPRPQVGAAALRQRAARYEFVNRV